VSPLGSTTEHALQRVTSRRDLLRGAALLAGIVLLPACRDDSPAAPTPTPEPPATETTVEAVEGYDNPTIWQDRVITVTSWGGEYQAAQERAIFEPFSRLTGATVNVTRTDIQRLRTQVETASVEWDLCDVLTDDVLLLANLGVLEELDYNVIDTDGFIEGGRSEHAVASSFFSTTLAYLTDRWPDQPSPTGWVDFWDLNRYPGTRGMHRSPQTTLEFALLADGVEMPDLYPLNVARALNSLERILWWEQGAQPSQMMTAGDLDMVAAWHSRIDRIQQTGANVAIQWNGAALSGDSWVIPRDSPNRDVAMDLINFATRPEIGAAFASIVPFGHVNVNAIERLPPELAARIPTAPQNLDVQFMIDHNWWFNHRETAMAAFENWLAEHP
jgi:putative spermidine/putrescine transport system substrate-binding protein